MHRLKCNLQLLFEPLHQLDQRLLKQRSMSRRQMHQITEKDVELVDRSTSSASATTCSPLSVSATTAKERPPKVADTLTSPWFAVVVQVINTIFVEYESCARVTDGYRWTCIAGVVL